MHTYTPANSVFDGPVTSLTFNTVHFDRNPFACSCKGGNKSFNGLKFGTSVGRFSSVGVIVKCPALPHCVVDGRSRNPLYYYY